MKIKDWSGRLIFATMLVTIVRYMGAFAAADLGKVTGGLSELLTIFLALSGAGMGFLDVLGGGLLFNGWRMVMPRTGQHWSFRFWVLTFCVAMLLISGSIILVPFTVSRMTQSSIVDTLGGAQSDFTWLWAWMVVLVPYFIIIGVFVGNKMVEGLDNEKPVEKAQKVSETGNESLPKDWRRLRPTLSDMDVANLASLNTQQVKELAQRYDVEEKTVYNWKLYAKREMEKGGQK